MRPSLYASLCSVSNFFFGKRDKHPCSASAIINLSMVSIVDSLLSTLPASANRILRCEANAYFNLAMRAVPLFFFSGCRPRFSRFAASPLNARARVHSPLKSEEKERDCSQSRKNFKNRETQGNRMSRQNHELGP